MNFLETCITNHCEDIKSFMIVRFDNDGNILHKVKVDNDHTILLSELINLSIDVLGYTDWELYIAYKKNNEDEE